MSVIWEHNDPRSTLNHNSIIMWPNLKIYTLVDSAEWDEHNDVLFFKIRLFLPELQTFKMSKSDFSWKCLFLKINIRIGCGSKIIKNGICHTIYRIKKHKNAKFGAYPLLNKIAGPFCFPTIKFLDRFQY
jgi:hypothetical protein